MIARRRAVASLIALVVSGLCMSCGASPDEPDTELPLVRYSSYRVVDPAYIANINGFFERRGIRVEFTENSGGATGLQAIAAGRAEVATAPVPALVSAVAADLPVVGVADQQSALEGSPVEEFYVRSDASVSSVTDLRGKTIAVNSQGGSFQQTILIELRKRGLNENDVTFVVLPFDQQVPALLSGSVDMIGLLPQFARKAEEDFSGQITKLFDALDVFGPKQFIVFAVNSDWASNNSEQAMAFVGGIADAVNWMEENPRDAQAELSEYTRIEERFLSGIRFQEAAAVVEGDIQYWIDNMTSTGNLAVDLSANEVVTNRYNPVLNP